MILEFNISNDSLNRLFDAYQISNSSELKEKTIELWNSYVFNYEREQAILNDKSPHEQAINYKRIDIQ